MNDPDYVVAECVFERLDRLRVIWMMWSSVALAAVTQKARSGRLNGRWREAEVNTRKVGGEGEEEEEGGGRGTTLRKTIDCASL